MAKNALARLEQQAIDVDATLERIGVDTSDLSGEEKQELAAVYASELSETQQGIDLQPTRLKINKDTCTFLDPFGNSRKELSGVICFKQKTRGYWPRGSGSDAPECSSMDGVIGTTQDGTERSCVGCPMNEWGSGVDESGEATKGKACKEMRRIFLVEGDASLPVVISLPPTSIREFDRYISARAAKNIVDLIMGTKITLKSEKSDHGFKYAVAEFTLGDPVPIPEFVKLKKIRERLKAAAAGMEITDDDYAADDVGITGAADESEGEPF